MNINKNIKNIRAKLKSGNSSNNQSIDNEYIPDSDKTNIIKSNNENNNKTTEKSLDGEISFNITPEEDEIKKELNKISNSSINKKASNTHSSRSNSALNSRIHGHVPLDNNNCQISSHKSLDYCDSLINHTDSDFKATIIEANTFEKENHKAQREAKELIEKTKRIMNNLDNINQLEDFNRIIKSPSANSSNAFSSLNTAKNICSIGTKDNINIITCSEGNLIPDNFSEGNSNNYPNLTRVEFSTMNTINYQEEKPLILSKILKTEKEDIKKKDDSNSFTNMSAINCSNSTNAVKTIKNQEKEIKEKNLIIEKLQIKVDKQKEEIKRLSDKLNVEKSANVKNELIQLQKKYKEKEDEINIKTKLLDNLFDEYNAKIENLINQSEIGVNKIKELENKIKAYKENEVNLWNENKFLHQNSSSLENQIKNLKDNFANEIKEKKKFEEKYQTLLGYIKNIFNNLKELSKSKENSINSKLTEKLKYFYSDNDLNYHNNSSLFLSQCFDLNENINSNNNNIHHNSLNNNINTSNNLNRISSNFEAKDKDKEKDTFILSNSNYNYSEHINSLNDVNLIN